MKEAFEKIRKRIEEIWVDNRCGDCVYKSVCDKVQEEAIVNDQTDLCGVTIKSVALSIVSEVEAEYGNGWIPCSERLPEEKGAVLVTYENTNDEVKVEVTMYEPKRKSFWVSPSVIAWMPLPSPYTPTTD